MASKKIDTEHGILIDVQYVRGNKKEKKPDYIYVIWKDSLTNEKYMNIIPEPLMDIYFEKEEFRDHTYNLKYRELEKLEKVTCKYSDIPYVIAEKSGESGKRFLNNIFDTHNYKDINKIHTYPYVFGSDYDVRVWYRYAWQRDVKSPKSVTLTKAFMDIEADSFEVKGFASASSCPIDLVTVIDGFEKKSYTFALVGRECVEKDISMFHGPARDKKIKEEMKRREMYRSRLEQEKALMNDLDGLQEELHSLFDETYGKFDYNFYFYTDEATMLIRLFSLINTLKRDFMMIWNASFDIPYIYDRLVVLGIDPKEVMCHPDFPTKECYFKKDTRNFEVKNKADFFHCSSYTIFYDQMILYAAIRKGRSELRSNKLNYIAKREIGDEKLDYSEDGDIKTIGYTNYRNYFIYNIKDVLLQYGIEDNTNDIDTLYFKSYQNITQYENVFKQTVVLRNVEYKYFMKQNIVPGANINGILAYDRIQEKAMENDEDSDSDDSLYEGALVGNPLLITPFGITMYNKKTNKVFLFSIDMDMSAFYPSTIRVLNIDDSTLIFKMILDSAQYDVRGGNIPYHGITDVQIVPENSDSFTDDIAGEVIDNFQTGNYITTAYKFMNLPNVKKMYSKLKKRLG